MGRPQSEGLPIRSRIKVRTPPRTAIPVVGGSSGVPASLEAPKASSFVKERFKDRADPPLSKAAKEREREGKGQDGYVSKRSSLIQARQQSLEQSFIRKRAREKEKEKEREKKQEKPNHQSLKEEKHEQENDQPLGIGRSQRASLPILKPSESNASRPSLLQRRRKTAQLSLLSPRHQRNAEQDDKKHAGTPLQDTEHTTITDKEKTTDRPSAWSPAEEEEEQDEIEQGNTESAILIPSIPWEEPTISKDFLSPHAFDASSTSFTAAFYQASSLSKKSNQGIVAQQPTERIKTNGQEDYKQEKREQGNVPATADSDEDEEEISSKVEKVHHQKNTSNQLTTSHLLPTTETTSLNLQNLTSSMKGNVRRNRNRHGSAVQENQESLAVRIENRLKAEEQEVRALHQQEVDGCEIEEMFEEEIADEDGTWRSGGKREGFRWNLPNGSRLVDDPECFESYKSWKAQLAFAEKYRRLGQLNAALLHTTAACYLAPDNLQPILKRSQLLASLGLWKQVILDTSRIIRALRSLSPSSDVGGGLRNQASCKQRPLKDIQLYMSARFLRAHAFLRYDFPNYSYALADLEEALKCGPLLRAKSASGTGAYIARIQIEKARIKLLYAFSGDKLVAEKRHLLEWSLDDLEDAKFMLREPMENSSTKHSKRALSKQLEILFELRARINFELFKLTQSKSQLEIFGNDVEEAYRQGLTNPFLLKRLSQVFLDNQAFGILLEHINNIQAFDQHASEAQHLLQATFNPTRTADNTIDPVPPTAHHSIAKRPENGLKQRRKHVVVHHQTKRATKQPVAPTASSQHQLRSPLQLDLLIEKARVLAAQSKYRDAQEILGQALTLSDSDSELWCLSYMAEIHRQEDKTHEALAVLRQVPEAVVDQRIETMPSLPLALFLQVRARVYLVIGMVNEALRDLNNLFKHSQLMEKLSHDDQVECKVTLLRIQLECFNDSQGVLKGSSELLASRAIKQDAKLLVRFFRVLAFFRLASYPQAISELNCLIFAQPGNAKYYLLRAWANVKQEQSGKALADLLHYSALKSSAGGEDSSKAKAKRARLLLFLDPTSKQALQSLIECHSADPTPTTLEQIVLTIRRVARSEARCLEDFSDLLNNFVGSTLEKYGSELDAILLAANSFHVLGDFERALDLYSKAMRHKDMKRRGCTFISRVKVQRGACTVQRILQREGDSTQDKQVSTSQKKKKRRKHQKKRKLDNNYKGRKYGLHEKYLAVDKDLSACEDNCVNAIALRAELLHLCGEHRLAIHLWEDAAQLVTDSSSIYLKLGVALAASGIYGKAITCFDKAIEVNPDSFHAWYNRGWTYMQSATWNHAVNAFTKASSIQPKSLQVFFLRGLCRLELEEYGRAIEDFVKAKSLLNSSGNQPPSSEEEEESISLTALYSYLAHCHLRRDSFDSAFKFASACSSERGAFASFLFNLQGAALLGKASQTLGHFGSLGLFSRKRVESVAASNGNVPDSQSWSFRVAKDQLQNAEKLLRKALQMDPTNDCARVTLGQAMTLRGDFDSARRLFQGVLHARLGDPAKPSKPPSGEKKAGDIVLDSAVAGFCSTYLHQDQPFQAYLCINSYQQTSSKHNKKKSQCKDIQLLWAVISHALGNMNAAYERYSTILQQMSLEDPQRVEVSSLFAGVCLRLHRPNEAVEFTAKVLSQHGGGHIMTRMNHAVALCLQRDFTSALDLMENDAPTSAESHFHYLFNRAALHALLNDGAKCQRDCNLGLAIEPKSAAFLLLRAYALMIQNRSDQAVRDFQVLLQDDSLVDTLHLESLQHAS